MKTIAQSFTSKGFTHSLVDRVGSVAIFYRSRVGGGQSHFEVVKIKTSNKVFKDGKWQDGEEHELYPSAEQWGTSAWTLPDRETARAKLEQLTRI